MNIRPMKFALFGNTYQAKKSAHVERFAIHSVTT